jgi:ribosomal protein S12 methylthiotransferase accessory factor
MVQQSLSKARVSVLLGGAIGSHALASLADSGVGTLQVLDTAVVCERDLPGSALLNNGDVGRPRAEALSQHIRQRNPYLKCQSISVDMASPEELALHMRGIDYVVVCLDSPAPALLDAVNQAALQANVRWVVGQVYSGVGWIGPTVIPRQTPCYKCYEFRRNANLANYAEVVQYESQLLQQPVTESHCVAPRPLAACIGAFLALEAVRLLTALTLAQTVGRILRLDFFSTDMTSHQLLRLPNCPACGYGKQQVTQALPRS